MSEETPQVKEVASSEKESAENRKTDDDGECLDETEVQIFIGTSDDSKVRFHEDKTESHDSPDSGGKLNVHQAAKKGTKELACSSQSTYENVTPETANNGNESDGDEPHEDDFSPKDLLRFAWQISQGMVSGLRFLCHLNTLHYYAYVSRLPLKTFY